MKTIPDDETAAWLSGFTPDPENFDWDEGNRTKNMKHGIDSDEIESIFRRERMFFFGTIVQSKANEWRGCILGQSEKEHLLTLIFTRRGERVRPICCRYMRPDERRLYAA